jgi:subtilisin family serine protease
VKAGACRGNGRIFLIEQEDSELQKPGQQATLSLSEKEISMKYTIPCVLFTALIFPSSPAVAASRIIVRDNLGVAALQEVCLLVNCSIVEGLDGTLGQLFLVSVPGIINPSALILLLDALPGIVDAEVDQVIQVQQNSAPEVPAGLYDSTPTEYFGTSVWEGYVDQPAGQIIRLQDVQSGFSAGGSGIVGVIDTGVDTSQPVLANVLVPGYDFTRNSAGGSEQNDVPQWNQNGQAQPAQVTQSTMAVVDPYNSSTLSGPNYSAFGHGTMVAGIIHLVAPQAQIMPLKAFQPSGTGYLSDVLRAVYYGVENNAKIINMSFDFPSSSREMKHAVEFAGLLGAICVAAVGNDGENTTVYPAGYPKLVIGVASTSDGDTRSSFSNYGPDVWVAAPGEAIITIYPFNSYAAGWGTSFSTPFVSGGVALLLSLSPMLNQQSAATAMSNAQQISPALGYGRIDLYEALSAFTSQAW